MPVAADPLEQSPNLCEVRSATNRLVKRHYKTDRWGRENVDDWGPVCV